MADTEAEQIDIFTKILKHCDVIETKLQALDFLLGLTASNDGIEILYRNADKILPTLVELTHHSSQDVARNAITALVNISAESSGAHFLISMNLSNVGRSLKKNVCKSNFQDKIFVVLFDHIFDENSSVTRCASMILVNLSRNEKIASIICNNLKNVNEVVGAISLLALEINQKYDYLPSLLANLSQLEKVREILLASNGDILRKLLTLIDYKDEVVRRDGAVSIIRNLCLAVENHEQLLDLEVDLLSRLLLPLAGPEEFDDEDNEKLPLDLQYLPNEKMREPHAIIRKMLLEILMQLCATKLGRELMRKYNVYVILRELHKWEEEDQCLATCEDLVNIIIRTEEEIGVDNLKNIEIPDLAQKFNEPK